MRGLNDLDLPLAAFAAAHYGVVSTADLRSLGIGDDAIHHRVKAGRLHPLYRGVFSVGHTLLPREGRWRAAVLACGEGAVLSHFDAAALQDLTANRGAKIHVTSPSNADRAPDPRRIALHRVGTLQPHEGTLVDGIPTTTPARTLLDLSAHLRPAALEDVVQRAIRLHRFDLLGVRRCLGEHPRQPGAPRLKQLLQELTERDAAHTRSDLERRFLQLIADHDLPRPAANARVEGLEVDFLWKGPRVIAETDGYAFHASRAAFEADRLRDQRLAVAGYTVVRLTHRQLTHAPEAVANRLRRLLTS